MDDPELMINQYGRHGTHEPIVWDHPLEHLEPQLSIHDQLRDARLLTIHLLNDFATEMLRALTNNPPTAARDALVKLAGISFGMGLNIVNDGNMTQAAERLGVTRACISKIATEWCTAHDLAPSWHMKSAEAVAEYVRARRREVANGPNGQRF